MPKVVLPAGRDSAKNVDTEDLEDSSKSLSDSCPSVSVPPAGNSDSPAGNSDSLPGGTAGSSASGTAPPNGRGRQRKRVAFRPYVSSAAGDAAGEDVAHGAQQTTAKNAAEAEFLRKQLWVKNARAWDSCLWWCALALLRLLLAAVQTGYIHPDEFHQSLQVRARDVLHIEGQKPWEYTSSNPVRSIVFSWFVSLPFNCLHALAPHALRYLDWTLLTPYALLVAPRVFMTLLSFLADFCVYQIARMCYIRPWQCMEVFASSYVMLVYATRTFSNTIELILMCVVLWRVSLSIVESSKVIRKETLLQDLYQTAEDVRERVRWARLRNTLPAYHYVDSFLLSVVITLGTFVRPTFVIYTFVPVAYWLQRGVITKEVDFWYFNMRCLSLLPGIVITFLVCVLADSFYYESLSPKELVNGNVTANSFTVTPFNFFLYNADASKVAADHGEHPHYLHVLVNLPLLHGVLAFVGLYYTSLYLSSLLGTGTITRKPKMYSLASMLLLSFVVPVLVLSCVPHQEARFLLPTLPCLILLHSDKVSLHNAFKLRFTTHFLFLMWHTWNIFCVVFFGFLHQGGVTKAMISVHDYIQSQPQTFETPIHVYFSHMYTPPTFLLMRKIEVIAVTEAGGRFRVARTVHSHHLSGSTTVQQLNDILHARLMSNISTNSSHAFLPKKSTTDAPEVLICLPGSVSYELSGSAFSHHSRHLKFDLLNRLPLHISLEHLPDFSLKPEEVSAECDAACAARRKLLQFSMEVYRVTLQDEEIWTE